MVQPSGWFILTLVLSISDLAVLARAKPAQSHVSLGDPVELDQLTEVHVTKRNVGAEPELEKLEKHYEAIAAKYEYDVKFKLKEEVRNLILSLPDESIFNPGFQYGVIDADSSGKPIFSHSVLSKAKLRSIEKNIYIDAMSHAAVSLREVDDEFHLNGYIDGARIKRNSGGHFITTRGLESGRDEEKQYKKCSGVINPGRAMAKRRGFSLDKATNVVTEVVAVMDYTNSQIFESKMEEILEYLSIFFNSINNRYAANNDPIVVFKLAGVYIVNSTEAEPYVNAVKTATGYTISAMLQQYGDWIYQNLKSLPKADVMPLITGVKSDSVEYGTAFLNGACFFGDASDPSAWAVAIAVDNGKTWTGINTLAHELAHTLGAPHDGEEGATDCPGVDGYIMSNEGGVGTHKRFTFSECAKRQMKVFIESTGGACLFKNEYTTYSHSNTEIGEIIDQDENCRQLSGNPSSISQKPDSGNDYCQQTTCREPLDSGGFRTIAYPDTPGDLSPCGVDGNCLNGICVNNTEIVELDLNKICAKRTHNEGSTAMTDDFAEECKLLKCNAPANEADGGWQSRIFTFPEFKFPEGAFPCNPAGGKCTQGACAR